jgi:hypothetical protein
MTYFPQNQNGQTNNANSSPVTISSDQIGQNQIASEESLVLLRRIAKLLESNSTVDSANRQKVAIEGTSTITTVSTLSNISNIANMDQRQFIDISRNTYANCIRSKLNFS